MSSTTQHEVKAASAVLSDDVICQSFIQSSSTLAYACLLIRQKKYELATHVLHSLEAKQASRFKDMVFYLQAQIGIETGEYAVVKKRLIPRVNQHPNDMVALSLLEADIYMEWVAWQSRLSGTDAMAPAAAVSSQAPAASFPAAPRFSESASAPAAVASGSDGERGAQEGRADQNGRAAQEGRITKSSLSVASEAAPPSLFSGTVPAMPYQSPPPPVFNVPAFPAAAAPSAGQGPAVSMAASDAMDSDFGIYQALASDENTQALSLGNRESARFKSTIRNAALEPLMGFLPQLLPGNIATACANLESGEIHKICFSFQYMTVTSLHKGAEQLALVTGNINQSLLTMVRAENIFQKQSKSAQAASAQARARSASQPMEVPSHE